MTRRVAVLAALFAALFVPTLSRAGTLETVRSRGSVVCGVGESFAGFFAMGEIGPVGGQNFLHGFTASIALFEELSHAGHPTA